MKRSFHYWIMGAACTLTLCASMGSAVAAWPAHVAQPLQVRQSFAFPLSISIFATHRRITTIGSTVDPINGDQNPYGLAIVPSTMGSLHAGDLMVCNFNNAANVQGEGTTVEVLRPVPGSHPHRFSRSPVLRGCAALALPPSDNAWIAAYSANDNPILDITGAVLDPLTNPLWNGPFGQAFSGTPGPFGGAAFYETNARTGSLVRINITATNFTFDEIVTGLDFNGGVPGSILAPSGLTYDASLDTLYVIDGNDVGNVYAIAGVSSVRRHGIHVGGPAGHRFTGPDASHMRVVFSGAPLNAPISAALLFNGNLVVGNTFDNRIVELNPRTNHVVGVMNVDNGVAGAVFGMAASGSCEQNTKIYFNDDNDNTVKVITR